MSLKYPASRILVRAPNWVGDAVMATPALRCLRRNYPKARIVLLARPLIRRVLEGAPWADDVIEYERPRGRGPQAWLEGARRMARTIRRLRAEKFDLAVLLTHSFRAALLARLGGARRRVANGRGQAWLLTDSVSWPRENGRWKPLPKVDAYLRLCEYLRCEGTDDRRQELFFSPDAARRAEELLRRGGADPSGPLFGIAPGASFGPSKLWNSAKFAAVADSLAERRGWQPVLLCGPGEERLADEIRAAMKRPAAVPEPKAFGLDALKAVVARCRLLVCTDSGARHLGAAFGVPTVVIMGPTDPRHTESEAGRVVILRQDVPCGPCHKRVCPKDHRCMELISAEQAIEAAERLLTADG